MKFASQHFAILGAGRSGLGAARLARLHGAEVTIFDEGDKAKQVEDFKCVLGQPARDLVVKPGEFDLVIISPGLDEHWPLPKKFTDAGVPLVGETEFAFGLTDMPIAAITGTNGKSTCTELIAALFNGCGQKSIPCGNHGMSLSEVVASGVRYDVLACEISSFQLETIRHFRAKASLWLNFAPDHLDRYPGMEAYFAAKARIFENVTPDDVAIVRAGETVSTGKARRWTFSAYGDEADYNYANGTFSPCRPRNRQRHESQSARQAQHGERSGRADDWKGLWSRIRRHAARTGRLRSAAPSLRTHPHARRSRVHQRLQGHEPACARSLPALAGASDRAHRGRERQAARLHAAARRIEGPGARDGLHRRDRAELEKTFGDLLPCKRGADMAEAVSLATQLSQPGDAIILSPGTSSFDMYTGYGQRGDAFRDAVNALN
jgi:UDP-N-acetylmuramoylalanine--D-glutamate ligase